MSPYDKDGNWQMTPTLMVNTERECEDQCCECRAAPGHPHAPDCPGWKWPEEDPVPQQNNDDCPVDCEARAARLAPSCPGCAPCVDVPLWEQAMNYGTRIDKVLDDLRDMLAPGSLFRDRVIATGFDRLVGGYEMYGSTMYGWDAGTRLREMVEEIADYGVYGTSGARQ